MSSSVREANVTVASNWKPQLGIARMTEWVDANEKAYWLLQVHLTPYVASHAGLKWKPQDWKGTPLVRVIWVNRGGHLAEYHELLKGGCEVQVPSVWELDVDEAIYTADQYSHIGSLDTAKWLREAQESSTLIEDVITWEEQKSKMAMNQSTFGPAQTVQRNGFPQELRRQKLRESNVRWNA